MSQRHENHMLYSMFLYFMTHYLIFIQFGSPKILFYCFNHNSNNIAALPCFWYRLSEVSEVHVNSQVRSTQSSQKNMIKNAKKGKVLKF